MNYFFMLLLTFFLGNCFAIYITVKHIIPTNFKMIFTLILTGLSILMYSYVIYGRYFSANFSYGVNQILSYIVYYFMGAIVYSGLLYLVAFGGNLILKNRVDINLYKFVIPIVAILLIVGTYFKRSTVVEEYEINGDGIFKEPLNIVLISDIHLGYINGNSSMVKLVKTVNSLKPDMVLVAGNTVDMHLKPVIEKNMLENFKNIKSKYGVFINIGNHDIYGGGVKKFTNRLNSYENVTVLRDSKVLIDESFYVASRDNFSKEPLREILKESREKPVLYMEHTPDSIDETVENKVFLQVSGHTHKGQFFPGELFTKRIFKLDYGYRKFQDTNVVVSSGYGTWGPPIRVGTQSEVVLIKVR
jgi:predicted MPP superfamily phosphohydrolase